MKKTIKISLLILLILIIMVGAGIGSLYLYAKNKLSKINYIEIGDIEITEGVSSGERYEHIALLGIDTREDKYTGCRSDCIIIITVDHHKKEIKLTSVYRDTYLDIPKYGLDKVTHAYAYGQAGRTLSTLNRNLDLDITKVAVVNFTAAKDIVNAVGGIKMKIDANEVKFIKGINSAGTYELTGDQALSYSRIRYTDGGDYKRTERMRDVLTAVFEKAKTKKISEITNLVETLLPEIHTNIDSNEIMSSIFKLYSYNIVESNGWPYQTQGKMINGVWYGIPVDLEESVTRLHKEVFGEKDYIASDTVKQISDKIKKVLK